MVDRPDVWHRHPDALWRIGGNGLLVLPPGAVEPVAVSGPGPAVWELLAEPCTADELAGALATTYTGDPDTMVSDLQQLLEHLHSASVVVRAAS